MKRHHLLLIALMAFGMFAMAAPLKNVEVKLTQPDGQVIHCFASGDEFYNYLHDANGFTIVQGENGYYVYAIKDARGEVAASSFVVGTVDPASVGLQPYVKISENEYYTRRHEREQYIRKPQMRNGKELNHGRYNNLVVFIRFAGDTYHNSSFSTVEAMFNADDYEANSLHNYYHHTSYNQLDLWSYFFPQPDGEVILSYEDIHPKQYYQPYDPVTNPIGYQDWETADREFSMLERAINYVEDMVPDTLDLDYNSDGLVDNVVFVIKGEPGEWASLLWPHRWCIYDRYVPLHDLQVFDFNLQLEQGGYFNVSTLCHEMFHSLGAPDLYHYSSGIDPVGSWDLMCGTTEPPQQTSTYMKYKYGNWVDEIPTITGDNLDDFGTYELESVSWEGGRRNGYMIPLYGSQYLFVEYRDKSNVFENQIPGSGLLIYRIDTRFDGNASWDGNDYFDEVYLFRPGGNVYNAGDLNQANFCEEMGRTTFNSDSDPQPFLNPGGPSYFNWGFQIDNISSTGDRISFDYRYNGEGGTPGPRNFIAHVNSQDHQVEFSWDSVSYADYYKVLRDGLDVSPHLTGTTFVHPFTEDDNGYHTYGVLCSSGGIANFYSAETKTWVILGNYEAIHLTLASDSPNGTKGGELEVSFSQPDMKTQYFTLYNNNLKEDELLVPANTEVTFTWLPGFDPNSEGIHVTVSRLTANGLETIFNVDNPTAGTLATYNVPDEGTGVTSPRKVIATTEGSNIRLNWMMPTEFNNFNVYRDGELLASNMTGYEYLDDQLVHSGTHRYQVEGTSPDFSTWHPENAVQATALCYYCEPPQNLQGIHYDEYNELRWEAPQFVGYGLFAYDDDVFTGQMGSRTFKWGIKISPTLLQTFEGRPLTHIEMYDCSAGTYKFKIYNGYAIDNGNLICTQQQEMTASQQMVRFPLNEAVYYDVTLPIWIAVESSGADNPAPYGAYVGEPNSCVAKIGSSWQPVINYDYPYTWLLRAYTSPKEENPAFTYNVYAGPAEGSDEQIMAFESLPACTVNHNCDKKTRYNVTAIWNGKESEFSNTVILDANIGIEEFIDDTEFQATSYQVIDMMGRLILRGDNPQDFHTRDLAPGVYILRLFNSSNTKTQKIVIK